VRERTKPAAAIVISVVITPHCFANSSNVPQLVSGWLVCLSIIAPCTISAAPFTWCHTFLPILHYPALPKRNLPFSRSFSAGLRINKFHRAYPPWQRNPLCRAETGWCRLRRLLMFCGKSQLSGSLLHFAASLSTSPGAFWHFRWNALWHRYL